MEHAFGFASEVPSFLLAGLELKSGCDTGLKRSILIRFAALDSGPNRDILDCSDDDSIDARHCYLCVEEMNLFNPSVIEVIAYVVFHFVHLVAETVADPWKALLARAPLSQWATATDMALTFVILEDGVNHWKRLARHQMKTGSPLSSDQAASLKGREFPEGIASHDAKNRFDGLLRYFYNNFYNKGSAGACMNMSCLQDAINERVEMRRRCPANSTGVGCATKGDCIERVTSDVLHRVFYHFLNI